MDYGEGRHCMGVKLILTKRKSRSIVKVRSKKSSRSGADPGGGGAGASAHPWDGRTRAEGAGSLVSRAERRDTGVS